jgi:hypothetical protein
MGSLHRQKDHGARPTARFDTGKREKVLQSINTKNRSCHATKINTEAHAKFPTNAPSHKDQGARLHAPH